MSKKIYHRNDIRPALVEMKLSSRRLVYMWLSSLPREKNLETGRLELKFDGEVPFELRVADYAHACDIDYSAAYRQIEEGVKDLMGFVLTVDHSLTKNVDPSLPKDWIAPFQVAQSGTGYSKGEGFVRICFAPELKPLISDLSSGFTGQLLQSAISLPESNASKLYLLLREWISSNKHSFEKVIELDELRESLAISNSKTYQSYNSFKNLFFERSVSKIIQKTEFTNVNIEIYERRGRKAHLVKIAWEISQPTDLEASYKKSSNLKKSKLSPNAEFKKKLENFDFEFDKNE